MMALQTYAMALRYVAESEESTSTSSGYPKSALDVMASCS